MNRERGPHKPCVPGPRKYCTYYYLSRRGFSPQRTRPAFWSRLVCCTYLANVTGEYSTTVVDSVRLLHVQVSPSKEPFEAFRQDLLSRVFYAGKELLSLSRHDIHPLSWYLSLRFRGNYLYSVCLQSKFSSPLGNLRTVPI